MRLQGFSWSPLIYLMINFMRGLGANDWKCFGTKNTCEFYQVSFNESTPINLITTFNGTEVSFYDSELTMIPRRLFQNFTNLEKLHIENVGLTNLHLSNNANTQTGLKELWADGNLIEKLDSDSLKNYPNLTLLSLKFNRIKKIGEFVINGHSRLVKINLDKNLITTLKKSQFENLSPRAIISLTGNKIKELGDVQWFRNSDRTIIDENVFCLIDLQKFDEKLTECQKDLDNCTTNYEETIKKYKNQTENNAKIRDCNLKVSEETAELNIIKFKLATYQNYTNSTFENSLKKSKEFIRHHAEKKETYLLVSISFAILLIIMSIVVSLAIPKKNPNLPKVKRAQVRFSPSTKLE